MQGLTYLMGGYAVCYMILRPRVLVEAISTGPGMGVAGWAFFFRHYKLTYPLMAVMLILLGLAVTQIPGS